MNGPAHCPMGHSLGAVPWDTRKTAGQMGRTGRVGRMGPDGQLGTAGRMGRLTGRARRNRA